SDVYKALNDGKKFVIAQIAPSVRSSIGEEFGMKPGSIVTKKVVSALRQVGFDSVMDTSTGADFTIMEEATELVKRLKDRREGKKTALPMFTSCCPAWVNYVESFHPELIENLSTSKSPYQMLGSVIKTYYAKKMELWDGDIVVVAVMPCTAKKQEAKRIEHKIGKIPAVDHVLTVREAAKMIRESGIELSKIPDDEFDQLLPTASGSGQIFGASGGVMEASLRTAEYILTGETKKERLKLNEVRGMKGIKKAEYKIGKETVRVAVVNGSGNVENMLSMIKNGEIDADFVEVMACPGGCVGGGGQPIPTSRKIIEERAKGLYSIDEKSEIRCAHENPALNSAYESFFGEPGGENAEKLLHTSYRAKKKYNFRQN
ncbi:MAG: [FeFe] hydrogenase, group A, partial [Candidatus Woesearchaeota archaeon]|nr:[FeFe] hydrogenase, group A [Candidatus Woesearchaeota archaeon]